MSGQRNQSTRATPFAELLDDLTKATRTAASAAVDEFSKKVHSLLRAATTKCQRRLKRFLRSLAQFTAMPVRVAEFKRAESIAAFVQLTTAAQAELRAEVQAAVEAVHASLECLDGKVTAMVDTNIEERRALAAKLSYMQGAGYSAGAGGMGGAAAGSAEAMGAGMVAAEATVASVATAAAAAAVGVAVPVFIGFAITKKYTSDSLKASISARDAALAELTLERERVARLKATPVLESAEILDEEVAKVVGDMDAFAAVDDTATAQCARLGGLLEDFAAQVEAHVGELTAQLEQWNL